MHLINFKFAFMNLRQKQELQPFYFNPELALENFQNIGEILPNGLNEVSANIALIKGNMQPFIEYCKSQNPLSFEITHFPFIIYNNTSNPYETLVFLELKALCADFLINLEINFKSGTARKFCISNFDYDPDKP